MPYSSVSTNSLNKELEELLDDISAYRDINNDFPNRNFEKELSELEELALKLFKLKLSKYEGFSRVKVAVIGNFSSGKSTFINSLLGAEVCPVKVNPTTSSVTKFIYGDTEEIFLIKENGSKELITKEQYTKLCQHKTESMEKTKNYFFEYRYPSPILKNIELYDTPGFENKKNPNDEKITKEIAVKQADVILFIQDIQKGTIEESTKKKIEELRKIAGAKDWYLIFNKADTKPQIELEKIKKNIMSSDIAKVFKEIYFYSAKKVIESINHLNDETDILEFKNWLKNIEIGEHEVLIKKTAENGNNQSNQQGSTYLQNILGNVFTEFAEKYTIKIITKNLNGNDFKFDIANINHSFLKERERLLEVFKEISKRKDQYINSEIEKLTQVYKFKKKEIIPQIEKKVNPILFYPDLEKLKKSLEVLKEEFLLSIPDNAIDSINLYCEISEKILSDYLKDFNISDELKKQIIQSYSHSLKKISDLIEKNLLETQALPELSNIILTNILDNSISQIENYALFKVKEVKEKLQNLKTETQKTNQNRGKKYYPFYIIVK